MGMFCYLRISLRTLTSKVESLGELGGLTRLVQSGTQNRRCNVYVVLLTSVEYGTDSFKYDTEEEAWSGMKRLRKNADEFTKEDGILRQVIYMGKETP